jgi:hypothetical protein
MMFAVRHDKPFSKSNEAVSNKTTLVLAEGAL